MTTTFKKRQKEMKRMEKARMKAERRAQKKYRMKTFWGQYTSVAHEGEHRGGQ